MIDAIIQVCGTIETGEADRAFAAVVGLVVDASTPVLAGVVPFCTKGYLFLAVLSHESWGAVASIGLDEVDAGCVVRAPVVGTIVDVALASKSLVAGGAVATVTHRLNVNRDIEPDMRSRWIRQTYVSPRAMNRRRCVPLPHLFFLFCFHVALNLSTGDLYRVTIQAKVMIAFTNLRDRVIGIDTRYDVTPETINRYCARNEKS